MIKAVIFDFDGTLVDNMQLHYDTLVKALNGVVDVEPIELFIKEGGKDFNIVSELLSEKDVSLDEYEIRRILDEKHALYEKLTRNLRMRPEAVKLIKKLKKLNYKIGLATGSPKHVVDVNIPPNDLEIFDYVLTLDGTKKPKPDPEPYMKCMKGLGVKPDETVVVENAPLGVESAKSAGCLCIALTSTVTKEDLKRADFVVDRLGEVEDIVKKL